MFFKRVASTPRTRMQAVEFSAMQIQPAEASMTTAVGSMPWNGETLVSESGSSIETPSQVIFRKTFRTPQYRIQAHGLRHWRTSRARIVISAVTSRTRASLQILIFVGAGRVRRVYIVLMTLVLDFVRTLLRQTTRHTKRRTGSGKHSPRPGRI